MSLSSLFFHTPPDALEWCLWAPYQNLTTSSLCSWVPQTASSLLTGREEWNVHHQHLLATASSGSHLTVSSQASQVFSFSQETQEDLHTHVSDSLTGVLRQPNINIFGTIIFLFFLPPLMHITLAFEAWKGIGDQVLDLHGLSRRGHVGRLVFYGTCRECAAKWVRNAIHI